MPSETSADWHRTTAACSCAIFKRNFAIRSSAFRRSSKCLSDWLMRRRFWNCRSSWPNSTRKVGAQWNSQCESVSLGRIRLHQAALGLKVSWELHNLCSKKWTHPSSFLKSKTIANPLLLCLGLGHTVAELELEKNQLKPIEKSQFSMCLPDISKQLQQNNIKNVIVCGIGSYLSRLRMPKAVWIQNSNLSTFLVND